MTIGDYCTLGTGSTIQCHSIEDGIFKAGYTVSEDGCTLGTGALVRYGVTIGQGAQLQPDPFLIIGRKGATPRTLGAATPPARCDNPQEPTPPGAMAAVFSRTR